MRWLALTAAAFALVAPAHAQEGENADAPLERPYFNDLAAPKSIEDLQAIQDKLLEVLPNARAALVGIEMGNGSGSGVIISEDGLILTAAHVSGGVDIDMEVILEDGSRHDAVSLGVDSSTDAAMIKIVDEGTYPFAPIDRTNGTRVGDWVFAMGHPGGHDEDRGSVVRLGRLVRSQSTTIQSDCKLIGGDSGGPIFDMHGRVIGINSRVGQTVENSMHVPMRTFIDNWDALLNNEFLGNEVFASKPVKGKALIGLALEELEDGAGLKVMRVSDGSGGQKAGVEEGDVLIKADDVDLVSRAKLNEVMAQKAPQDRLKLVLKRGDEEIEVTVKLGTRPE